MTCSGLTSITSLAMTAPTIGKNTFNSIATGGTLYYPSGATGYDVWMGTGDYYLGSYNWTSEYYTPEKTIEERVSALETDKQDVSAMTSYYTTGQTDTLLASKLNVSDIDDELSSTSENPVQNKVIYAAIGDIETILQTI